MNNTSVSTNELGDNAQFNDEIAIRDTVEYGRLPQPNESSSDYAQYLTHPILLYHATFTSATASVLLTKDLFALYLSTASGSAVGDKLKTFYYMGGDFHIKVVIQGQPFAGGMWVLVAVPELVDATGAERSTFSLNTNNMMIANFNHLPHVIIDPSKNATYDLMLPCPNAVGRWSLKGSTFGSYRVVLLPIVPLITGTASAASMGICIYGSVDKPSPQAITLLSAPEQASDPCEFVVPCSEAMSAFVDEKKPQGTLSSVVSMSGKVAAVAGMAFPPIEPFTTLYSMVAGTAGEVLALFGYSKPRILDNTLILFNRQNDPYTHKNGKTGAISLAGSQSTSLGISPRLGGGTGDDMAIANICSKKGFIETKSILPASAHGALVHRMEVTPMWAFKNAATYNVTPIAGVASMFQHWTGDITVTFEVVATVFHRATLLICYDPLSTTPTLATALQTLQNTTIVVSGNTSIDVVVPWQQVYPWAQNSGYIDSTTGGAASTRSNGSLYIFVVNPVTSNGSTDGIYVNMYVKSDNIAFGVPDGSLVAINYPQSTALSAEIRVSEPCSAEAIVDTAIVQFGSRTDLSHFHLRQFGEKYDSVKELASRLAPSIRVTSVWSATLGDFAAYWPCGPMIPESKASVWSPTFLTWIASAYVGYRGGTRYSFYGYTSNIAVPITPNWNVTHQWSNAVVTAACVTTYGVGVSVYSACQTYAYSFLKGGVTTNTSIMTNTVDVESPSICPVDFYNMRSVIDARKETISAYARSPSNTITESVSVNVYSGASDDATFCWFVGFPEVLF
jgi:hypothetical protein